MTVLTVMNNDSEEMLDDLSQGLLELDWTHYHEAGHAVSFDLYGFRPRRIHFALTEHDRRTTSFFRTNGGLLKTPHARQRAEDYAVCAIAGIAAEAKARGIPLAELRYTSGKDDYGAVHAITQRLLLQSRFEMSCELARDRIRYWESRAIALINNPIVWKAVESVVEELYNFEGELQDDELHNCIREGLNQKSGWTVPLEVPELN